MTTVDIHCHTFNADDLPVKGFVRRVVGARLSLAGALGWVLDKAIQGLADGADELAELDRRLTAGPGRDESAEMSTMLSVDAAADELMRELEAENPTLLAAAQAEAMIDAVESDEVPEEGLLDGARSFKRYVKWAVMFGEPRWRLTTAMMELYPEIDLFTPLLVDFQGLEDAPATSMLQQLELQERISRLTILGHTDAVALPFVGFDPRRVGALALAQEGIHEYGAIGVKMYPPMGFLPIGNRAAKPYGMPVDDAIGVDAALAGLYDWCVAEDIPITAHSNPSNYAHKSFRDYSQPSNWARVLNEPAWSDLRLNLGHFGWGARDLGWPSQISRMMATAPNLFADIGNHDLHSLGKTMNEFEMLFADPDTETVRRRLMFGTDWFMVASHVDFEQFHDKVRDSFNKRFPGEVDHFMGGAALDFLGFTDVSNANAARLHRRFESLQVERPEWLSGDPANS